MQTNSGNGGLTGQDADGRRSGNYSDGLNSESVKNSDLMYPSVIFPVDDYRVDDVNGDQVKSLILGVPGTSSMKIERRNEDRISTDNMRKMMAQSLQEMFGMSVDDMKIRFDEIDQIKKQSIGEEKLGQSLKDLKEKLGEIDQHKENYLSKEMFGMSLEDLKVKLGVDQIERKIEDMRNSGIVTEGQDEATPEMGEIQEKDDEPGIAVEKQMRIKEQSAKVIDILTSHLHSTVWQGCSKNTYGFFIRVVLLCGSRFKRQLITDTYTIFPLALLGVLFSAGMQFILAWYLWTRLPSSQPGINGDNAVLKPYPGTGGGRGYFESPNAFARVPLPAYEYPNYRFANDICRTAPIVQLVCVGLFLFSILNNVPGIMKNIAIIWASERFVSVDEDGITKLHYWRESGYSREPENRFLQRFCTEYLAGLPRQNGNGSSDLTELSLKIQVPISVFICEMYFKGSILTEDVKLFAGAARRRWMLPTYFLVAQPRPLWGSLAGSRVNWNLEMSENIPRSFFDVSETRSFLAEALRLIDNQNNVKPTGSKEELKQYSELEEHRGLDLNRVRREGRERLCGDGATRIPELQPIQFCDKACFNLVRMDYLKPSTSWLRPQAYKDLEAAKDAGKSQGRAGAAPRFVELLMEHLGKQFSDLATAMRLQKFPARMRRFRLLAFLLGVLPEVLTLTMITVVGIPYILWSGFKVGSDTQGMEEIILATLAIVFIYDIDESVYDHILPELYKEAHERDRFELSRGWISSETPRILSGLSRLTAKDTNKQDTQKRLMRCNPLKWEVKRMDSHCDIGQDEETEEQAQTRRFGLLTSQFDKAMDNVKLTAMANVTLTADYAMAMSESDHWNDLYLARAYPFLYARKLRYALASHVWEKFLIFYGSSGLHYVVLLGLTLIIVGGYRSLARCERFAPPDSIVGIFSAQPWPTTCLLSVGPTTDKFSLLNGSSADDFMAVSCGVIGYVPQPDEWQKNKDFFTEEEEEQH